MHFKKFLATFLSATMLCSPMMSVYSYNAADEKVAVEASKEEVVETYEAQTVNEASGTWGENVTWELDDEGTLTISGTGDMTNCSTYKYAPWYDSRSDIKTVIIGNGITSVGDKAFYHCSNVTEIVIPNTVTRIGKSAFFHCSGLTEVVIPDCVKSICEDAFNACSNLKEIVIPSSVTVIDNFIFYGCSSLTKIVIPSSITSISNSAFSGCSSLVSITVHPENEYYSSDERGVLFNEDKTTLIRYPMGNESESYVVPGSVININSDSFMASSNLVSVTMGNNVQNIENAAFSDCTSLAEIVIPDSVTTIANATFNGCSSLTEIVIPDSVISIGASAFYGCSSLKQIVIPNNVTRINGAAFCECSSLISVTIGKSVEYIGDSVFSKCSSLTAIIVDPENEHYANDERGVLYNKVKTTLLRYPEGNKTQLYIIPTGVISIGEYAFDECLNLTELVITEGVTSICQWAFNSCSNLTKVVIPKSVTSIDTWAFYQCLSLAEVYYAGNEDDWGKIMLSGYNTDLEQANFVFNFTTNIMIDGMPKVQYLYGEELSLDGMTVYEVYSDGSAVEITDYTVTGYDKYTFGEQILKITYGTLVREFKVWVKPATSPREVGTTVAEFIEPYATGKYSVVVLDNDKATQLKENDIIKTGCIVQFLSNESVVEKMVIVVKGDATGDGIVNIKDLIRIKKEIINSGAVEYKTYADINCDGVVDEQDLSALAKML